MTVTRYAPFALTRFTRLEMTPVAFLPAYLGCEVAPMRFTPDDDFYDEDDTAGLSDCAVGLLARAGSWSARKLKNGFVPASMLAQLSSTPAQAAEELCRRGIWRRAKRGGFQFTRWTRWGDLAEDVRQREADTERRREQGRVRSQRKRDRDKEVLAAAMAAGVTPPSRGQTAGVTLENRTVPEKPQVNGGRVTRYEARSSRVTANFDTSDNQDQSPSGVSQSDARAREAPSPEAIAVVTARASKRLGRIVSEAEACRAIAVWDRRAEDAGEVIHDPVKYYPTCVKREHDLEAIMAAPLPAPPPSWLAPVSASGPGAHVFEPAADRYVDECAHPGCGLREKNARHVRQEAGAV